MSPGKVRAGSKARQQGTPAGHGGNGQTLALIPRGCFTPTNPLSVFPIASLVDSHFLDNCFLLINTLLYLSL